MKTTKILTTLALLGLAITTTTWAQDRSGERPGRPPMDGANGGGERGPGRGPRGGGFLADLPTRYAILAAADVNHDQQLDATEQAALVTAIDNGELAPPPGRGPRAPRGDDANVPPQGPDGNRPKPDSATVASHMAEVYAQIAPYDANNNGKLDKSEMETIRQAVADGKLTMPGRGHGPRGERPEGDGAGRGPGRHGNPDRN